MAQFFHACVMCISFGAFIVRLKFNLLKITAKDHEDLPQEKHVWFLPSVKLAIPYKMNSGVAVFYEEFCFNCVNVEAGTWGE